MKQLDVLLSRLEAANVANTTIKHRLRLWSNFVIERDGCRCIFCGDDSNLRAHHICRKSYLPEARLLPGNGVALCRACHSNVHEGFNGRPDASLPMDAQGGEKIEIMADLFAVLLENAVGRGMILNRYYYFSEAAISHFNYLQGFSPERRLSAFHLEHICLVWRHAPQQMLRAVFEANGFNFPKDTALRSDEVFIGFEDGSSEITHQ